MRENGRVQQLATRKRANAHEQVNKITIVFTGVAQEGELETLSTILKGLKSWVQRVGKPQMVKETPQGVFFRYRVKLADNDIPRLRAVLDFYSNGWDASSRFETVREVGDGPDVRYAMPADEQRVAETESENRAAELVQLQCQVNT
jgi:hypothetical protein